MKIPNFLHLTPPHIKKHCAALRSESITISSPDIWNVQSSSGIFSQSHAMIDALY